jgi:hypothetical protein
MQNEDERIKSGALYLLEKYNKVQNFQNQSEQSPVL